SRTYGSDRRRRRPHRHRRPGRGQSHQAHPRGQRDRPRGTSSLHPSRPRRGSRGRPGAPDRARRRRRRPVRAGTERQPHRLTPTPLIPAPHWFQWGAGEGSMRKAMLLLGVTALAGCGQSNEAANQVAKAPAKKKAAYCFFKEPDTKAWTATRGKDGNIVVKGKAFRQDPRYKAVLGPATVTGTRAEISPSVGNNDTGFAA